MAHTAASMRRIALAPAAKVWLKDMLPAVHAAAVTGYTHIVFVQPPNGSHKVGGHGVKMPCLKNMAPTFCMALDNICCVATNSGFQVHIAPARSSRTYQYQHQTWNPLLVGTQLHVSWRKGGVDNHASSTTIAKTKPTLTFTKKVVASQDVAKKVDDITQAASQRAQTAQYLSRLLVTPY